MSLLDKLKKGIFALTFTLIFVSVICAAENEEKEIYIMRNRETGILMVIDENGKILAKSTQKVNYDDDDDNFILYKDAKDEKVKIIYESTYGEEAEKVTTYETFMSTGDGSEYTEEYSWLKRKKFNYYYDLEGNKYENVDREDEINFLYDGYGFLRQSNSELKYGKIYDFNKKEYKKYDVDIMRLFLLNGKVYGSNAADNFNEMKNIDARFYTFDDEMNLIKIMNYDEWSESNGEDLDYIQTYYNGVEICIGEKGDMTYILDKNKKIASKGYKCKSIKKLNKNAKLEDSIYARTDNETITYFTLEKDILTTPYDYHIWDNLGYGYHDYKNSTIFDKKMLVGTDLYYILPENVVNVASSSVSYIYKATESEPFSNLNTYFTSDELFEMPGPTYYLYDFYIYYNTILAKYKDLDEGTNFWYYKNIKTNEEFACRQVLNAENLQMMERPIALITFNLKPFIKAYDVKTGELVKIFNRTYDSNSLLVFKSGNKSLNLLKKMDSEYDGYADVYDVYDKDLKLINTNIEIPHNYGGGGFINPIIDYRKYEIKDDFSRNEEKMVEKYYCVSDFDNNLIMKEEDGAYEIFILEFGDRSIIQVKDKKEGTYVLYDEKGKKLINNDKIEYFEIFDDILIASDNKNTYIYDKNYEILKTIDRPILYANRYNDFIVLTEKNHLDSLLDKNYNFIGENYKYIDMHDNFYTYEDNFKIYLKDFNHKLICEMSAFNGLNEEDNADEYGNDLSFDGSTACIPLLARVRADYLNEDLNISRNLISVSTTDYAWRKLTTDAGRNKIVIAYEPSSETKDILSYEGNPELLISAIGEDALVFIANASNQIDNLSTANLQDIYTGKIENWKDVGGDDIKIEAYQRPLNSGSQTLFLNLLMKDKEPTNVEEKYISYGMDDVINAVASYKNTKNAIGYSVYYYAKKMYGNDDVKMISVDNIEPNDETISSEKYPYTNPFYIAIRADEPEDSDARKIYNMVTNMNYSTVIKEEGYTPCKEVREVKFKE